MYGIDFGTSNTVITSREADQTRLLDLGEGAVVPSLLYFEKDRRASIGARAMEDYAQALERFRGERDLYARFRFFQAIKLALKDEYFEGTSVFGERLKPEALAGIFLRELKHRADEATGRHETRVVLGRPVSLSPKPETDALLQERFRSACHLAGFEHVSFVPEPVGAAASLLGSTKGLVMVFDFGGGTLDVSIARLEGGGMAILASAGADLGGYLLDEDLSRAHVIRHFGSGGKLGTMTGKSLDMPLWLTRQVASFHALPLGDLAKTRAAIREVLFEARQADKPKLRGLIEFIDRNLGFRLFEALDGAKIALSDSDEAELAFAVPPHVAFRETLRREAFEALIAPRVEAARGLVLETLARAGLEPGDLGAVVRVGGSCRVPAFARMLEALFPGRVREGEVFTSIASGLIEAAERGLAG